MDTMGDLMKGGPLFFGDCTKSAFCRTLERRSFKALLK